MSGVSWQQVLAGSGVAAAGTDGASPQSAVKECRAGVMGSMTYDGPSVMRRPGPQRGQRSESQVRGLCVRCVLAFFSNIRRTGYEQVCADGEHVSSLCAWSHTRATPPTLWGTGAPTTGQRFYATVLATILQEFPSMRPPCVAGTRGRRAAPPRPPARLAVAWHPWRSLRRDRPPSLPRGLSAPGSPGQQSAPLSGDQASPSSSLARPSPHRLSQVLLRPAVRRPLLLVICPLRLSIATCIPDSLSLTPYILWCFTPIAAHVFGGTMEASYASL